MRRNSATIDKKKYRELIGNKLPRVVNSEEEHARAMNLVEELINKGTERSVEETELLKLLMLIVSDYELKLNLVPTEKATPLDTLIHLMESNNHTPKDLWKIADKSVISKVLNGERPISKNLAKGLADFYNVSPALFI